MTRRIPLAALICILAATGASRAQSGATPRNDPPRNTMAEDIEIMRRLLAERLAGAGRAAGWESRLGTLTQQSLGIADARASGYGGGSNPFGTFMDWTSAGGAGRPAVEGVYLDGKGVVFTATLPAPKQNPMPTTGQTPPPAVSDWERARRELRGEKPQPTAASATGEPSISDVILALLAKHGKHLHLRDNEDLIVAITFRDGQASAYFRNDHANYSGSNSLWSEGQAPVANQQTANQASREAAAAALADASQAKSAHDYELLGDLHMRQKQYQQAAEAYSNALQKTREQERGADMYRKLADARLQLGEYASAKELIDKAQTASKYKKADQPAEKQSEGHKSSPLPGKLIITISRRTLENMGDGKMSADDFIKGTKIDYFPVGDKK